MRKHSLFGKGFAIFCSVLLLTGTIGGAAQPVYAYEYSVDSDGNLNAHDEDGFYYLIPADKIDEGECILYVYGGKESDIALPKKCDSYRVTVVGKDFSSLIQQFGATFGNTKNSFTSVKIPYGYEAIESGDNGMTGAFQNQTALKKVEIPESVKRIGKNAFDGCDFKKLTIVAPYGSVAQKYAKTNGIKYKNNVKLSKSKLTLKKGKKATLKLRNTKKKVTWKSSNKTVVSVDSKGTLVAKKSGTATITAKAAGKTYQCVVSVKK